MIVDRRFRLARLWSNEELKRVAPSFGGNIVNVSAWDDRDKQGGYYRDYFIHAETYSYTNYGGYRGLQGLPNEYSLDLTDNVPEELKHRFDVAFNHTTLEHLFDVRKAFANLCEISRDVVIVVVPFVQVQHESDDWKDYWRFTPSCLRELYDQNGFVVLYEAESPYKNSSVYLFSIGSRHPDRWENKLPPYRQVHNAGQWIGRSFRGFVRKSIDRVWRATLREGH